jgi:phosphotransacetylase/acyl dehydratase
MSAPAQPAGSAGSFIENRPFEEIAVGDQASLERTLTREDIQLFAVMSGDVNPAHLDAEYAKASRFREIIAHGMWGGALISALLGTKLPGPGTIYVGQSLRFLRPVHVGDTIKVSVTVTEKDPSKRRLLLDCLCANDAGEAVIRGVAEVIAPTEKVRRERSVLPQVLLADREQRYRELLSRADGLAPITTAVVNPTHALGIESALDAAAAGLIRPIFVGRASSIAALARSLDVDLSRYSVVDVEDGEAASRAAVAMAKAGQVGALLNGHVDADALIGAASAPSSGLHTARCMSHVFVLDVPRYPKPLLLTDAAINAEPDLEQKADIVQSAIDLAHALGIERPKVAILSAIDTVTSSMRSTFDAAALCKMADRGQIVGGVLDGPLAFDNAVSIATESATGAGPGVGGFADVLVVPDLQSGTMLVKQLEVLADAQTAGIVVGARVPIVLACESDSSRSRVASCAIALLFHHRAGRAKAPTS